MDENGALNGEFLEAYKHLDKTCRDIFQSEDGVSQYIRELEKLADLRVRYAPYWERDYNQLRHVRSVRNQVAHELGAMCSEEDLEWTEKFCERILNCEDTLSIIRKGEEEIKQRKREREKARKEAEAKKRETEKAAQAQRDADAEAAHAHDAEKTTQTHQETTAEKPQRAPDFWDSVRNFVESFPKTFLKTLFRKTK